MTNSIYYGTQKPYKTTEIGNFFPPTRKRQNKLIELLEDLAKKHGPTTFSFPVPYLSSRFKNRTQKACWEKYLMRSPWSDRDFKFDGDKVTSKAYKYYWQEEVLKEIKDWYNTVYIPNIPDSKILAKKSDAVIFTTLQISNFHEKIQKLKEYELYEDIYILDNLRRSKGSLFTDYHAKSGRYWCSIQQLSREARAVVFDDYHTYDISSCLPTVFNFYYPQPYVSEFIEYKEEFRQWLVDLLDIDYDASKAIFNAVFFGCKTSTEQIYWIAAKGGNAWLNTKIGPQKTKQLLDNPSFSELVEQIQKIKKAIVKDYFPARKFKKDESGMYRFVNLHRSEMFKKSRDQNALAAFFYFGIESIMLDLALELTGTTDVLLLHDGVMCKSPIDHKSLEQAIKFQLRGLEVSYKHSQPERLQINASGGLPINKTS